MRKYCITGATGYIGSLLVDYILKKYVDAEISVIVRNKKKALDMLPAKVKIIEANLSDRQQIELLPFCYDYFIHCASVTKSAEMIHHPTEVIESIVNITQNILEMAKHGKLKSFVYISSMEVYGNVDCSDGHRVKEDELGELDLFNERSCYPIAKRMAENICYCYYKEFGLPIKIVRLSQVFGRGVLNTDTRVFSQFARAVIEKKDIELHTLGNSTGNYCSIDDALKGIMLVLETGVNGEAYNVVNEENTMTIKQMAELVANDIANGTIKIRYEIPQKNVHGYAVDTGLRLSSKKIEELGWKATQNLIDMYKELIAEL